MSASLHISWNLRWQKLYSDIHHYNSICPKFYHCQVSNNFPNIAVTGIFKLPFSWNHDSLKITKLTDKTPLSVPFQVSISLRKGLKLRIMSRKTIFAYLLAEHSNDAFHLRLCPEDCEACVMTNNAVGAPTQNIASMLLYLVRSTSEKT